MMQTILKSLLKSVAYPEPTSSVELLQTHISWIFLTDNHAYKIKKPVDFGFLNFSTIDRRRFYCNEEVRLNRRLCPDTYEGVVELRETPHGAAFYGAGPVLDYAVKMKRLPAERMLDRLVANGEIGNSGLREVARVIADFHRLAATSPAISEYGHVERIMFNWNENFEQVIPFENSTLPASEREKIRQWTALFADENQELFNQRVEQGFIRECNGDIHLENICMTENGARIFDCIEFNERFRYCDTAADIAFLLMDLDINGRRDLAEETLATYLEASGDAGLAGIIDFYKIYRAFVRGKVESFRLNDSGMGHQEKEVAKEKAMRYFRLARGYIERQKLPPALFITCGLMGCGKSTLANQLSFELNIKVFNSDTIRKQMAGIAPATPVAETYEKGVYSRQASEATYNELSRLAAAELAAGRPAIIDASFIRQEQRLRCADLAKKHNARFVVLLMTCSDAETRRRLAKRAASGASISDGREELLDRQRQEFEPPNEREGLLVSLDAAESPARLADRIYGRIS